MAYKKINYVGSYTDMSAVWDNHPEGGREGDWIKIGQLDYKWNIYTRQWEQIGNTSPGGSTSETIDGDLNVGGNLNVGNDAHINGDVTIEGTLNVSRINLTNPLPEPKDGQSIFKSIVFIRSASRPTGANALTDNDGTYYNPVPVSKGWSDGVPPGTDPIWMATRVFTDDAQPPQGSWTTPQLLADIPDNFDVEFSPSITRPAAPNGHNQHEGDADQIWFDPVLDANAFNSNTMIWMATRTRNVYASSPTWGPWDIIKIVGEAGNDGMGVEHAYCVYQKATPPVISRRNRSLPESPQNNPTWKKDTNGLVVSNNSQAMYMSQRNYTNNVYSLWSDPVRISGDGPAGADGSDIEFIYKQMDRLPTSSDAAPTNSYSQDDYVPTAEGWYDEAKGVDSEHKCEWMCQRTKERGASVWSDWVGPFAWSVYGDTGMDGASVQYVFKRTTAEEGTPARPDVTAQGHINEQGEYIPYGWTDDPMGVNSYYSKEWVSIRRKGEAQTNWGAFSPPALWATYSEQHTVEIIGGTWWIDGRDTGKKAEGEDGKGIALKGVVDWYSTSDTGYTQGTTLQEVTGMEVGDCYVVNNGEHAGFIYAFNGGTATGNNWVNNWTELGEFRGEPGVPGTSQFFHIAWAYNIRFNPTTGLPDDSLNTIYLNYSDLPIATNGYPDWVGLAVTNSIDNPTGADPTLSSSYDWNHVRGKDGSDYERVYIKTRNNVRPVADVKINNDDEYYPDCTNADACGAYGVEISEGVFQYKFTDDPVGPDPVYKYEWMAERKKKDGVWGEFGETGTRKASLWATYSTPPEITIDSEGYWCIGNDRITDSQGHYVKARGENGQGIELKGSFANAAEREAYDTTNLNAGDCFYQIDTGHLWMWNGTQWQYIGEIKGQPGDSQYMYIAWAKRVQFYNNEVIAVYDFTTQNAVGVDYDWIGFLASADDNLPGITSAPTDPTKLAFKWNYVKGKDGDDIEYVYIRTTTVNNPGVKTEYESGYTDNTTYHHAPSDDEFLPLDYAGVNEYTDDPNGVDKDHPYEWMSYRRKIDNAWGYFHTPVLIGNWSKDGAGQAAVDTEGIDNIVIDCGSDGKPKEVRTFSFKAKLFYGENAKNIDTSNSSVTVVIGGFTQSLIATGSNCTFNVTEGASYYTITLRIKTGNAISSGTITISLQSVAETISEQTQGGTSSGQGGSGSTTVVHTATKVINVIANKDGQPGGTGQTGPCLRFRGDYVSTELYVYNSTFRDCVKHNSTYWLLNVPSDGATQATPASTSGNPWLGAGANLKFFATELMLAENGAINLLSSNVINLFDGAIKTASINADGQGSYCIYYKVSPFGKCMEFSASGFIIYYNNDADNTVAWTLGHGGDINKATTDDWVPIRLKKLMPRDTQAANINANTHYVLDTYYMFIAGTGSSFSQYGGKIFKGCSTLNPSLETLIDDGNYTRQEDAVQDLEEMKWSVTTYPVNNGVIDYSNGTTHYGASIQ